MNRFIAHGCAHTPYSLYVYICLLIEWFISQEETFILPNGFGILTWFMFAFYDFIRSKVCVVQLNEKHEPLKASRIIIIMKDHDHLRTANKIFLQMWISEMRKIFAIDEIICEIRNAS